MNTKKMERGVRKSAKRSVRREKRSGHRIGLSVSFCIRDMAMGKVPVASVEMIVAGTGVPPTKRKWDQLINRYRDTYWRGIEDKAEKICRRLLKEGRIFQPRLQDGRVPFIGNTRWVANTHEIVWCQR